MSLVILTLYEFHNSSSCISVDGEIKFAFNEDRFAKIKNEVGLPIKSAKKCIESLGIDPSEIDYVGIVNDEDSYKSYNSIVNYLFKRQSRYSIKDWIKENKEFWHPTIFKNKKLKSFFKVMGGKNKIAKDHYFKTDFYNENKNFNYLREIFFDIRRKSIKKILRIDEEKIKFIPHYICHHYHAYYSYSKERNMKKSIIIHAEGDGGKYNQGVSIPTKNGLKFINGTNKFNLGRLYQWVTLIMGMKPYHDEYKVMGLSPYSKEKYSYEIFLLLKKYFKLNKKNDSIEYSNNSPKDLYFTFQNILKDYRFDNIAGGLQLLLEVFISEWVSHIVTKYKRNQIYYAGGVAMNVKANLVISEIKKIKKFFVPISPADESNVFGANYYLMEKYFLKNKIDLSKIKPITSPYLGLTYAVPLKQIIQKKYKDIKIKKSSNLLVARKLLEGKIIGRFVERAEFGQRALGNRSIIASPFGEDIVKKLI